MQNKTGVYLDQIDKTPIPPKYLEEWVHVGDINHFKIFIEKFVQEKKEMPIVISIAHDLTDEHVSLELRRPKHKPIAYEMFKENTGLHACHWLAEFCGKNNLEMPQIIIHGLNDTGNENCIKLINNFYKAQGSDKLAFKHNWEYV